MSAKEGLGLPGACPGLGWCGVGAGLDPTGHVAGPALTVPLGVAVRLVAGETSRLVIEEAAVAA